jgi:hypothetical protein
MAVSTKPDYSQIDVHDLLESRRQIAVVWNIEDVQEVRKGLSDDQAWEVLLRCQKVHDCNDGITWLLLEYVADDLFPRSDEDEEQGDLWNR